ncbi:MAG: aminopeptidase [Longimicrobiaceae bacterium]
MVRSTLVLALALVAGCSGCSIPYLLRAGIEQAKILNSREPISDLIRRPSTPEETRDKLRLVLDARDFAARYLNLDAGDSYTTFARLESDTLALVLSAARKDEFRAHSWWFPLVGSIPYKGFFDQESARRELRALERRGYDTYLRPTAAFSTLGWFADPLYSSLLRYHRVSLVGTVIHELLHNTVYLPDQAAFNESLATFVGARGSIAFFCGREGEESAGCRTASSLWRDDLRFGNFLDELISDLERLYGRDELSKRETLRRREVIFVEARSRFREELRPALEAATFAGFEHTPLNNATLISRRLYYDRLDLFEEIYRAMRARGKRLPEIVAAIIAAAESTDDPWLGVEELSRRFSSPRR